MSYTISEAAAKIGVSAHTLRFYDKEGLLPFVSRKASGVRLFREEDLEWLRTIEFLKATRMPIKEIKTFIAWCMQGDSTLQQRFDILRERRQIVEAEMAELQRTLNTIIYKCWFYQVAITAGTTDVHRTMKPDDVPSEMRELRANSTLAEQN